MWIHKILKNYWVSHWKDNGRLYYNELIYHTIQVEAFYLLVLPPPQITYQ